MKLAAIGVVVLLCSLLLTRLVRMLAQRWQLVAAPRKDRWHQQPTALMGGVAIYLSFALGCLLFANNLTQAYPILMASTLLFLVGLVDDLKQLKPYIKLVLQLVAAAIVVYGGLRLPWTTSEPLNYFITIFWLVGITNAVNLLDNMDGLAGGISFVACVFMTITFLLNGQSAEALLPVLLGGAVLGFLFYNFNPATIFMGDCGSMFLGFMLGGTSLLSNQVRTRNLTAVLLPPVLILLIPIFDTCVVTITRKLSGRPISQGGRDHTSHRLVALGMSERRAVLMIYLFATICGVLSLLVREMRIEWTLLIVSGFALTVLFVGLYLGKVRIYDEGQTTAGPLINVLADFTHKRRIFEIMLDLGLVMLAYYGAYALRFDGELPGEQWAIFLKSLPLIIAIQMLAFLAGGVYRGLWRYAGADELLVITRAIAAGGTASAVTVFVLYHFSGPSRAVFILNAILLLLLVGASRYAFRLLRVVIVGYGLPHPATRPVVIYGAGDGGELLLRELLNNPELGYHPACFVDDDARKWGKIIRGRRIFNSSELPRLLTDFSTNEVLVSSFKVSEDKLSGLRDQGVILKRLRIQIEDSPSYQQPDLALQMRRESRNVAGD